MRLRLTNLKKDITLPRRGGEAITWDAKHPENDVPDKEQHRLQTLIDSGILEEVGPEDKPKPKPPAPKPEPEPEPKPEDVEPKDEDVLDDILKEGKNISAEVKPEVKVVEFDISKWDGEELPAHLNSKSELMRQNKDFLKKMCLTLGLNDKGPKPDLAERILEEFEED